MTTSQPPTRDAGARLAVLVALMLSAVQHRESLRLLRETYGRLPQSVAGPGAALTSLLDVFALIGVSVRV